MVESEVNLVAIIRFHSCNAEFFRCYAVSGIRFGFNWL